MIKTKKFTFIINKGFQATTTGPVHKSAFTAAEAMYPLKADFFAGMQDIGFCSYHETNIGKIFCRAQKLVMVFIFDQIAPNILPLHSGNTILTPSKYL